MLRVSEIAGLGALLFGVAACGDGDQPVDAGCGQRCEEDARSEEEGQASDGETDARVEGTLDAGTSEDAGDGLQQVTIRFKAKLGEQELVCGQQYERQGKTQVTATPQDFRFFVQDVRLVRKGSGQEERVAFDVLSPFQSADVALIDFTDGKGSCAGSGGSIVNTTIRGRVARGEYDGIVFSNGVPEALNHAGPAEMAQAPLDDVTLFWGWLGGYRFLVAELLPIASADAGAHDAGAHDAGAHDAGVQVDASVQDGSVQDGAAHDAPAGEGHHTSQAGFVHIGSTGCDGTPAGGFTCARQARNEIRLSGFDPARHSVVADLAALFSGVDLKLPPPCHGIAPDCAAPYAAFGVDMESGTAATTQQVFRVE